MDRNYPMKLHVEFDDCQYEGMLHLFESCSNSPHLVLASYVVSDLGGNIKQDYTDDPTRVIVLDSDKAKNIEIVYNENSQECKFIDDLCRYHKSIKVASK